MPVNNPPISSLPDDLVSSPTVIANNGLYYYSLQPVQQDTLIRANNKTFVFYLAENGTGEFGVVLDHETGIWGNPVYIADSHGTDSHNFLTVAIDSLGYFYAAYGAHDDTLYYRKSSNPYDISSWSAETSIATISTYPKWVIDSNDNIYLFYRYGDAFSINSQIRFIKSINGGSSWSSATSVVETSDPRLLAYSGIIGLGLDNSLHLIWTERNLVGLPDTNDPSQFVGIYYAKSLDGGTTWKQSNGTSYTLPVNSSSAEAITTATYVFPGNIVLDTGGSPHLVYVKSDPSLYFTKTQIHYAYLGGGTWHDVTIEGGTVFELTIKLLIDENVFYIFTGELISGTREIVMFRSIDSGNSWSHYQLTSGLGLDNLNVQAIFTSIGGIELAWAQGDTQIENGGSSNVYYVDNAWIEMLCGDFDRGISTIYNGFMTIAVPGESSIISSSPSGTVTFVEGTGIGITTDGSTGTVTFTNTGRYRGWLFSASSGTLTIITDSDGIPITGYMNLE